MAQHFSETGYDGPVILRPGHMRKKHQLFTRKGSFIEQFVDQPQPARQVLLFFGRIQGIESTWNKRNIAAGVQFIMAWDKAALLPGEVCKGQIH